MVSEWRQARWRQLSQVQFKLSIGSGPTEPTLPDSESARASRSVDSWDSASCLEVATVTDDTCTPLRCGQTPYMWPLVQDLPWPNQCARNQYMISLSKPINFKTSFYNCWRVQSPSQNKRREMSSLCAVALPWRLLALFLPVVCWFHIAWELFLWNYWIEVMQGSRTPGAGKLAVSLSSIIRNRRW